MNINVPRRLGLDSRVKIYRCQTMSLNADRPVSWRIIDP
jgi:hypothetical protein